MKPKTKTRSICVKIEEEQYQRIKNLRLPLSFLIRKALDSVILNFITKTK